MQMNRLYTIIELYYVDLMIEMLFFAQQQKEARKTK